MNGSSFENIIVNVFKPFLEKIGFEMDSVFVSGRYYRASFVDLDKKLSITFEPGDDQITVMLITKKHDDLQSIDDPERTPRLSNLNAKYMGCVTASERAGNEIYFKGVKSQDRAEDRLIKCAKDLRLVLPRHLGFQQ